MENQTRFDLNAAIESWRQELAAQADITAEARRELETHLRDSVAGLQQRGLNDEESFWLARRRVGRPQLLGEELKKANPFEVWRERLLWMALAVLAVSLWNSSATLIYLCIQMSAPQSYSLTSSIYIQTMLRTLPFFAFVIYLLQGRGQIFSRLAFLFQSRSRFVITAVGWFALNEGSFLFRWLTEQQRHTSFNVPVIYIWTDMLSTSIWPLTLIALIAWLLPAQNRKTAKTHLS
jgi:hypothetical protein